MSIQLRQWLDIFQLLETKTVKLPIPISNRAFGTQCAYSTAAAPERL